MTTLVLAVTVVVEIAKPAEVLPFGIVTVAGTVAHEAPLESAIVTPPGGAAVAMVTVPIPEAPPLTDAGLTATEEMFGGLTVNVAD